MLTQSYNVRVYTTSSSCSSHGEMRGTLTKLACTNHKPTGRDFRSLVALVRQFTRACIAFGCARMQTCSDIVSVCRSHNHSHVTRRHRAAVALAMLLRLLRGVRSLDFLLKLYRSMTVVGRAEIKSMCSGARARTSKRIRYLRAAAQARGALLFVIPISVTDIARGTVASPSTEQGRRG